MGLFGPSVPDDVRELVVLARGERVLASADTAAGWVIATTRALWLPDDSHMTRVGWESVDNAAWSREDGVLQVVQTAELGGRPRRWTLPLDDERDLLLVIKERVRSTVVASRRVPVVGERGVTVVARRSPGQDRLTWAVSVDAGLDVTDPRTRAVVDETLAGLRSDLGR